jgi:16S rRNA (guanine966-N2)-methyltransferase
LPKQYRKSKAQSPLVQAGLGSGQLRIIGGKWRGRKLPIMDADGLRPTSNRIRETLFNWLSPTINNSICLDLFAGSGALSIECLSRGASKAIMIEKYAPTAHQLRQNCETLKTDDADIIQQDAITWLHNQKHIAHTIDIVFIDPPFAYKLWDSTIDQLHQSKLLAPNALIYIESPKGSALTVPEKWHLYKAKTAGRVNYALYENESEQNSIK